MPKTHIGIPLILDNRDKLKRHIEICLNLLSHSSSFDMSYHNSHILLQQNKDFRTPLEKLDAFFNKKISKIYFSYTTICDQWFIP